MNLYAYPSIVLLALCCGCQSTNSTTIGGWGPVAFVQLPEGREGQMKVRLVHDAGKYYLDIRNIGPTSFKLPNRLCSDTDMVVQAYNSQGDNVPLCVFDVCPAKPVHTKMIDISPNETRRIMIVSVFDASEGSEHSLSNFNEPNPVRYQRVVLHLDSGFRDIESGLIQTRSTLIDPLNLPGDSD